VIGKDNKHLPNLGKRLLGSDNILDHKGRNKRLCEKKLQEWGTEKKENSASCGRAILKLMPQAGL